MRKFLDPEGKASDLQIKQRSTARFFLSSIVASMLKAKVEPEKIKSVVKDLLHKR